MWKYLFILLVIKPAFAKSNKTVELNSNISTSGRIAQYTDRFTIPTTTRRYKTPAFRQTFKENCDYLAHYCLKAYNTGKLCGRTINYKYYTFKNYCMLDYVNCMERYEIWQVVHMGECFNFELLTEYALYPYDDDAFLDDTYVIENH